MIDHLAENGRRIQIIRPFSINNTFQFFGVTAQAWGRGLSFIRNLQAPAESIGWVSGNYYNRDWGGRIFDSNSIINVA